MAARVIPFKSMLRDGDFSHGALKNTYPAYASNGAKTVSWGGTFKTNFIQQIRTAKSFNANFNSFSDFRVLAQSAIRTRIGYQVLFDPVTKGGTDYYTFAPAGGSAVSDPGAPWDAKARFDGGTIDFSGKSVSQLTGVSSPRNVAWAYDGANFAYWDGRAWYTAGDFRLEFLYWNGKGPAPLLPYYEEQRWPDGVGALQGELPFTAANLIPGG